jgi:CBS domain-containing protein
MEDEMMSTARDLMTADVRSVRPDMTLADLERALLEARVGGFPVVSDGRLVGVISRSDIVRQLAVEQSVAELASGYQREGEGTAGVEPVGAEVGRRMEGRRIEDMMIRKWIGVRPDVSLRDVAKCMVEDRIHRLLVVEDEDRLLGIITSTDLVRLIAEEKLQPV